MVKMRKTLHDFILKYGEEQGIRRFEGHKKAEETKKQKYNSQPYKRLTKDWYIWRYGKEIGLSKFNEFALKCAHTLENFIKNHGEIEGTKKYLETIEKKNTVRNASPEEIKRRYDLQKQTMDSKTDEEKQDIIDRRRKSTEPYLDSVVRGKSRLEVFIHHHGEKDGIKRYNECIIKTFQGPSRMTKEASVIYEQLKILLSDNELEEIYCDDPSLDKKEFWLLQNNKMLSYDFTHRKSKTILEYDGAYWHPLSPSDEIHEITKLTLTEMYHNDINKLKLANDNGFTVLKIRSSDTKDQKDKTIDSFIKSIRR